MQPLTEARRQPTSPFWANGFRLVSLKELLMQYAEDEFQFGPFANLCYVLGALDDVKVNQINQIHITVILERCLEDMERFGFRVSARNTKDVIQILNGTHPSNNLPDYITMLRSSLMAELESTVFLPVDSTTARFYREPRHDWQEVIQRFPNALSDIEEMSKCYALGRYAASIYHSMQVFEIGLLELGKFMGVSDPKSGFTAVANALMRVLAKKHPDLTDFERKHRAFFEQVNGLVQAAKDAWRNKVSHSEGRLVLLASDFSPQIAMEIFVATRAYMRRLATELPT